MIGSKSFKITLSKVDFRTNIGRRINIDNPSSKIGSYSYLYNNGEIADENWEFHVLNIIDESHTIISSNLSIDHKSIRYYLKGLNEGLVIDEVIIETHNGSISSQDVKFYLKSNLIEHSCETINKLKSNLEVIKNMVNDPDVVKLINLTLIQSEKVRVINRELRDRIKELKSKS